MRKHEIRLHVLLTQRLVTNVDKKYTANLYNMVVKIRQKGVIYKENPSQKSTFMPQSGEENYVLDPESLQKVTTPMKI